MSSPPSLVTPLRSMYPIGDFVFDLDQERLFQGRREIHLRPKSLNVLACLVKHRGHLVTKSELIDAVWPNTFVSENSLTQCLSEVRRALGSRWRSSIRTIARRGYLLNPDDLHVECEFRDPVHVSNSLAEERNTGAEEPTETSADLHQRVRESQIGLYLQMCDVTATICSLEVTAADRRAAVRSFWLLYWGRMAVVADEVHIGPILKEFAYALEKCLPSAVLCELSMRLAQSCRTSLSQIAE